MVRPQYQTDLAPLLPVGSLFFRHPIQQQSGDFLGVRIRRARRLDIHPYLLVGFGREAAAPSQEVFPYRFSRLRFPFSPRTIGGVCPYKFYRPVRHAPKIGTIS